MHCLQNNLGGIILRKKHIPITVLFTIVTTYLAVYFQWTEFYEGYSCSEGNLFISLIFLSAWLLFSFYWGKIQQKEYRRFIIVYWGVNIISAIVIWIFANNKLTNLFTSPFYAWNGGTLSLSELSHIFAHYNLFDSFLLIFYIWFGGPLYGFRDIFFTSNRLIIGVPSLILITSPLGILSCLIGYWYGGKISKLKKS